MTSTISPSPDSCREFPGLSSFFDSLPHSLATREAAATAFSDLFLNRSETEQANIIAEVESVPLAKGRSLAVLRALDRQHRLPAAEVDIYGLLVDLRDLVGCMAAAQRWNQRDLMLRQIGSIRASSSVLTAVA